MVGNSFLREPLLHFLLLAALLFAVDQLVSAAHKEKVVVDRQTAEFLIQQRQDLELRELTPEERRETVDAFVEDEILYSEAYKRGLDRGDSRMRRNLILKMRGLLIGDIERPTDEELRAYFEANRTEFTRPAALSLEHVFFSDPAKAPANLVDDLRAGLDPTTIGEQRLGLGRSLPRMSQRTLLGTFGVEAARAILAIQDDQWHGPFESTQGVHFVRIVGRRPPEDAAYEDVKTYLEGEWMMAQSRKVVEQEINRLRDDYEVIVEDAGESTR